MCDTMVSIETQTGNRYFAKNSDRHPKEPQLIHYANGTDGLLESDHPEHRRHYDEVQYETLRTAAKDYEHPIKALLSRPSWMWGAEMGVNARGVAIGNEAVFSRSRTEKRGLLGMDILRLALHNAADAPEAVRVITDLIERFGQGGNGSYEGSLRYHNSFLITDSTQAYVVETSGRRWVARQISDYASISNAYTIGTDYQMADRITSEQHADFAATHASRLHLLFTKGHQRQRRSESLLADQLGSWSLVSRILRDTRGSAQELDHGMASICMDATGMVSNRTTASMIVAYEGGLPLVWLTGAPLPIYAPFIPFTLTPESFAEAPHALMPYSYQFARERIDLNRQILSAPSKAAEEIAVIATRCEQRWHQTIRAAQETQDAQELTRAAQSCLAEELTYREDVMKVLIAYGAESPSLHQKPDRYYRCG